MCVCVCRKFDLAIAVIIILMHWCYILWWHAASTLMLYEEGTRRWILWRIWERAEEDYLSGLSIALSTPISLIILNYYSWSKFKKCRVSTPQWVYQTIQTYLLIYVTPCLLLYIIILCTIYYAAVVCVLEAVVPYGLQNKRDHRHSFLCVCGCMEKITFKN